MQQIQDIKQNLSDLQNELINEKKTVKKLKLNAVTLDRSREQKSKLVVDGKLELILDWSSLSENGVRRRLVPGIYDWNNVSCAWSIGNGVKTQCPDCKYQVTRGFIKNYVVESMAMRETVKRQKIEELIQASKDIESAQEELNKQIENLPRAQKIVIKKIELSHRKQISEEFKEDLQLKMNQELELDETEET
ncbi:MAG: hypothetical protein EZS28_001881 [Streblomastix strix]|uniref:Uncharacterized protein n=1 Tax=Streblomastix strix TaxID=222440 RepID=A0A5J4X5Y0_9EUKA|nr:MAG: hypothetical protein EZS28_001881 [Streblomastix strix]